MSRPNFLHIMQCANLGGMEKSTLELMSAARSLGCENRLISLNPIGGLGPLLKEHGIPAKGLNYRRPAGVPSIPEMARAFREAPIPDAIVMTGHNLSAFAALAGNKCKKRILFLHYPHKGVMPLWQWRTIYAAAMHIFPRIAFCSDFIREEAEEIYPPLRRVSLTRPDSLKIPPLPSLTNKAAARKALAIPDGFSVVGNAGWLIRSKRWDVFLQTAARVAAKLPDTVFLACGDGPLRNELIQQSRALGLETRLRWLGWQKDLTGFYLALDVLLFNSDWESMGMTPLEASAHGVPVVASVLRGGLRETIRSEKEGFLADRHDEDWLEEKTILLLHNPALGNELAAACRTVLEVRHDPLRNARELLELCDLTVSVGEAA
jgi:glycosyltransferase involved in cell wall biosynthesis